jgi:integrase
MNLLKDLDENASERLLARAACSLDRIAIMLLIETGLDLSFLLTMKVSDVDTASRIIRLQQGDLRISEKLADALASYTKGRSQGSYLLEGRCGKPLTPKWERCVLNKIL